MPRDHMDGIVLSDDDHKFLASLIGPCHGSVVERFLAAAPTVPGGRRLNINHPTMELLLEAIGTEVHGYMKLDEEESGRARLTPKRGGTAERLLKLYRRIEQHWS